MNKSKAIFVTALLSVMLLVIDAGCLKLWPLGFGIITGTLAVFGFWKLVVAFSSWLEYEPEDGLDVPMLVPQEELGEVFTATYDEIKAEMEAET